MGLISKGSLYLGSHFFGIFQTLLTWPDLPEPQFISVGFVDDIPFERLNSRADFPEMEHCAPWIDHHKPDYWKEKSRRVLGDIQSMKQLLQLMLYTYNYSTIGECTPISNLTFTAFHVIDPVLHVQAFPL